ncbi:MAG: hypothetical protein LBO20_00145, partial [Bifidobacteriaceae bacterium]|nr:hypothetical protein [Bifidobacteriaceae bacterium]
MTPRQEIAPAYDNPTLAELTWVGVRKLAHAASAAAKRLGWKPAAGRASAEPGPKHVVAMVPGSRHTARNPSERPRALLMGGLRELWRRPAFAAAVAGTVAAAFPLALLAGGNTHTFALWHDPDVIAGGTISAGDLDTSGSWTGWELWYPSNGSTAPSAQGACLTAPDPVNAPDSCGASGPTKPLD